MGELFSERKKKICDLLADPRYVPMKEKELAIFCQVGPQEREELTRVLEELLEEKKILRTKRGRYVLAQEQTFSGVFRSSGKGFGFVTVQETAEEFYIPEGFVGGAMHQDTVKIRLLPQKRGPLQEAQILEVIQRAFTQVVGTYQKQKSFGFVVPDNPKLTTDIFIPGEKSRHAADRTKVVAQITDYGDRRHNPEGEIVEILGQETDPGVDILSVVRAYGLPETFSQKVLGQAQRAASPVSDQDCAGRRDLRGVQMVTIDGADARDLDDAVSLTEQDGRYLLGVHIADVANYVQENSALDWEAKTRGTSVYLADRVIPMLPGALSNGICSLQEGEDRLALSCLMEIDAQGNVTGHEITESVIRVDRRMNYDQVERILEGQEELTETDRELAPMLERMARLSAILRRKRQERGAVDFDFPECQIELDEQGFPVDIRPRQRSVSMKLIEDFMLAANETVAEHFFWLDLPFVYRTHEKPDPEKLEKLSFFLSQFGYRIRSSGTYAKELQKLLDRAKGTPEEGLIGRLVLRSMKRAAYTTDCTGHYGLAARYYCHFTSPIRRYPDLQIHRIIKDFLRGRLTEEKIAHYREILPGIAQHSSAMERRGDEAEREVEKRKKVQFMQRHIGQVYEGVICGVTGWGLYVELPNTAEGLVHIGSLPGDYYLYHEESYELTGERTGVSYKLGQKMWVKVSGADAFLQTLDLEPATESDRQAAQKPSCPGGWDGKGKTEADCEQ